MLVSWHSLPSQETADLLLLLSSGRTKQSFAPVSWGSLLGVFWFPRLPQRLQSYTLDQRDTTARFCSLSATHPSQDSHEDGALVQLEPEARYPEANLLLALLERRCLVPAPWTLDWKEKKYIYRNKLRVS